MPLFLSADGTPGSASWVAGETTGQWTSPGAFPLLTEDDEVIEYFRAPYDITVTGIVYTPVGDAVPGSSTSNVLSVLNGVTSLLAGATVAIDGGTLFTPVSADLSGTPANLNVDAGDILVVNVKTGANPTGYGVLVDITFTPR